ncbi:unnamed protein product [Cylindrotheca closterium]|uniref:Plastid lipid-associated protein/fibrillin conserved domain-containing protein n=1 Tax=Cylindrotheca closterium TaxID=2856 RepID=A0AAD2FAN3_9STRA|nr:unnamed protein product [Cylindrotheca closterium]
MKSLVLLSVALLLSPAVSFQNLVQGVRAAAAPKSSAVDLEEALLQEIKALGDSRLANSATVQQRILELENSCLGIQRPAISDSVYGRWRLLHTDNANTASPIQRKAVDSSAFPIYQDIIFNNKGQLLVSQVVKFNNNSELKVDALASTSAYPLQELTERKGDGKILGLNLLGVSKVGSDAEEDSERPDSRINFVFDEGKFDFENGFSIPYPVPFRLPFLRDAVKGWIDVTYLSERVRISRGNKGTTFVLVKE